MIPSALVTIVRASWVELITAVSPAEYAKPSGKLSLASPAGGMTIDQIRPEATGVAVSPGREFAANNIRYLATETEGSSTTRMS